MDWRALPYSKTPVTLFVNSSEVARLCRRVDGSWYAVLNQHLAYQHPDRRDVDCTGYAEGMAGVEAWAQRHRERLERETREGWERARDRC